jgi:O-antigen ligase
MTKTEKIINWLTYASLMTLALGLFTSITFSALHHIFILIPCLFYFLKTNFKVWSKSQWLMLGLIITIVLSVLFNQDIAAAGYAPLTKIKYYLIALLAIEPLKIYFERLKKSDDYDKKISWLLYAFLGITTLVTISGLSGVFYGFNFLILKSGFPGRNGGMAGMMMNYAHNLAMFQVIITGLILYRSEIKRYLNLNFLYAVWFINLIGLYTTFTRGAWLGFLAALPFFFIKKNKKAFIVAFFSSRSYWVWSLPICRNISH